MDSELKHGHLVIERVEPQVDCGRYRAKAVEGDRVEVTADIFRDGPHVLQAVLRYRGPGDARWLESPMEHVDNDRWAGSFVPTEMGRWRYVVQAWTDHFGTWARELRKRVDAGQTINLELEEGALLIEARLDNVRGPERERLAAAIETIRTSPTTTGSDFDDPRVRAPLAPEVSDVMSRNPDRGDATSTPALELWVDRERARFGAWYELFPRSTVVKGKHGTLKTTARALQRIAGMGFDVVYFPPIHPIGETFRKGRNNTLEAKPDDVGVPWAIGSKEGGHTSVHPDLGTIADFDDLVAEAERLGLEIALDFAIQCSPDHPWVKEHPDWFLHRPDGSIKYAENPPKKYQDIYPINFDTPDREGLWNELRRVVEFWVAHGVKIFRVDNPHTKSFHFWEWLIDGIHETNPEVVFLAEAFTRPKVMKHLAKLGFTQSYTYFTWRNTKQELTEYMEELAHSEMSKYFRPNFFVNTPDILHEYLQKGGPPAFKIRLVLAALLSPTYGIYSGYELFEDTPVSAGSEEYLDSEKYEVKRRDFDAEPNLASFISLINEIRNKRPALGELTNLHFHHVDKDAVIAFSKTSRGHDPILVVVNLNPSAWEEATVHLDLGVLGLDQTRPYEVHDLITDTTYVWRGSANYVRLDPEDEPAHVFQVRI